MTKKKVKSKNRQKRNYSKLCWLFGVGIFYLILAVIFTYPLINNFSTSIIGDPNFTDGPFFLWNMWWVHKAAEMHVNPLISNYVYYPSQTNLALHTLTFTRALISLPFQNFFSLIVTSNILQIGSLVLSALGAYSLVYYFTKDKLAGLISGMIFAFSPFVSSHLLAGHLNLADLSLFPFALLFFIRMLREKGWWNAILAAFIFVGICFNDLQIGFYIGTAFLIIGIIEIISNYRMFFNKTKILQLVTFIVIILTYFLVPYLLLVKGFWSHESLGSTYSNGDLRSYIMANPLNPFSSKNNLIFTKSLIGGYRENTLAIGWVATSLALACLLFIRKNLKEKLIFFVLAIIFVALSMGPYLQVDRHIYDIRLPFFYLQEMKIFAIGIVTTRFILVAYFSLAILAGLFFSGLREFLFNRKSKILKALFYFVLVSALLKVGIANYSGQMMLTKLEPTSPILGEIKNDTEDANVLVSLCGVKGSYYQTKINKKVVSGSLGRRVHDFYMTQYNSYPGVNLLVNYDNQYIYSPNPQDKDRVKFQESLNSLNVKYILLCKDQEKDKYMEIREYLGSMNLGPYKEDGFVVLYKLK